MAKVDLSSSVTNPQFQLSMTTQCLLDNSSSFFRDFLLPSEKSFKFEMMKNDFLTLLLYFPTRQFLKNFIFENPREQKIPQIF